MLLVAAKCDAAHIPYLRPICGGWCHTALRMVALGQTQVTCAISVEGRRREATDGRVLCVVTFVMFTGS